MMMMMMIVIKPLLLITLHYIIVINVFKEQTSITLQELNGIEKMSFGQY